MEEEWKDIKGFEGYYQVSNLGRVRSLDRRTRGGGFGGTRLVRGKILAPYSGALNDYLRVSLMMDGVLYRNLVHRLVAGAFILNDDPKNKTDVHHKDYNVRNNRVTNLAWVTKQFNVIDSEKHYGRFKHGSEIEVTSDGTTIYHTISYCKNCGVKIVASGRTIRTYCDKCLKDYHAGTGDVSGKSKIGTAMEHPYKVPHPSKDDLEKELYAVNGNFTKLSSKYGVTDNAIRKWCKSYNLPYHSRDYK